MSFEYDDRVSPEDVRKALGLEDFRSFAKARREFNRAHTSIEAHGHGLSRQTGRSTEAMVTEIAYLLGGGKRVVEFPFKHHDNPDTVEMARHDRARFNTALVALGVRFKTPTARPPWSYLYEVVR
jgi:hypothetical protein